MVVVVVVVVAVVVVAMVVAIVVALVEIVPVPTNLNNTTCKTTTRNPQFHKQAAISP